jgi:hypothetical protein
MPGLVEPFSSTVTLEYPSVHEARKIVAKLVDEAGAPIHSATVVSEDRKTSERWFQIDGTWRRKDVKVS